MSGLGRAARVLACAWLCACVQTDVIARERPAPCGAGAGPCSDAAVDAGGSPQVCRAAPCADFGAVATRCSDTSPHVSVGDGCSPDGPPRTSFRHAVCSCTDFVSRDAFTVEAWDSRAATTPAASDATVAVNGGFSADGALSLAGTLQVGASASLSAVASQTFSGALVEQAAPGCACDPTQFLDVAGLVAAHAADNDNAVLGVDPSALAGFSRSASAPAVELGCGRTFLSALHGQGALRLHVTGHAAVFVQGDLAVDDDFVVELEPGAALDLFVAGNLRAGARFSLGAPSTAPNARLYVGGSGTIDVAGEAYLGGTLYAPRAELVTRAALTVEGSVFVRRAAPLAAMKVRYDVSQAEPETCTLEAAR